MILLYGTESDSEGMIVEQDEKIIMDLIFNEVNWFYISFKINLTGISITEET